MKDLQALAKRIPDKYIKDNPTGYGTYVSHAFITQRLLAAVGPFDYRITNVYRGNHKDLTDVVVGVSARLSLTIDGNRVEVEEVGDCENPSNWPHDGARLKDASSDAIKRCAMRFGLGLQLWADKDPAGYFLPRALVENGDAPTLDFVEVARGEAVNTETGEVLPIQAVAETTGYAQGRDVVGCPECGSKVWNNIQKKLTGKFKPESPDFSCSNKDCEWAHWNTPKAAS